MKSVYIDLALKKYIVPTEMRDFSKSDNKIYTPGTRIPLPNNMNFIRLFTAWASKDGKEKRIDIDLAGAFLKEAENTSNNIKQSILELTPISFSNQSESFAVHSGDFTSCRNYNPKDGKITAEFIDIDIKQVKQLGFKYAIIADFIYSGANSYNEIDCWSGVQLIENTRKTENKFIDISDNLFKVKLIKGSSHVSLAIDFETNEIVIIDKYSQEKNGITIEKMAKQLELFKRQFFNANLYRSNMFDFIEMYIKAKKYKIETDINKADIIISNEYIKTNGTLFNISDNLEKILGLLK